MGTIYVKSRNLFDEYSAKDINNWSAFSEGAHQKFTPFVFKKGVHYTLTLRENNCSSAVIGTSSWMCSMCVNSTGAFGGILIANSPNYSAYNKTSFSIYNETKDMYLYIYGSGLSADKLKVIFEKLFVSMQITEGENVLPYAPYGAIKVKAYIQENGAGIPVKTYLRGE